MSKKINIDSKLLYNYYIVERKNLDEIAQIFNCSSKTIRKNLDIYKIKARSSSEAKQIYFKNENYFLKSNKINSYWGGFISADGCISDTSKKINSQKSLVISLQSKDKNHLYLFKKDINFTGPIKDKIIKDKRNNKIYNACSIELISNQIVNNLFDNYNITPRKSLTLKPPNLTNRKEILSFIIGYIDGDGSIVIHQNKLELQITGTKELLNWINNNLSNFGHTYQITDKNTYSLRFWGNEGFEILNMLKNHAIKYNLPILKRKWDKV